MSETDVNAFTCVFMTTIIVGDEHRNMEWWSYNAYWYIFCLFKPYNKVKEGVCR